MSGETLYVDALGLWQGAGGVWAMPGQPITHTGRRVTHPNTTDTLIEVWDDGAGAWVVSDYDSGWRDVTSLLTNGWSGWVSDPRARIRRIGNVIHFQGHLKGSAATGNDLLTLPTGWRPGPSLRQPLTATDASNTGFRFVEANGGSDTIKSAVRDALIFVAGSWVTKDTAVPTSLLGTPTT